MTKDATKKTQKKVVPMTCQGPSGASTQAKSMIGTSNNERTGSLADTIYMHPELISTVQEGRNFLEN